MNSFGISETAMAIITTIFSKHERVKEINIYGSRAKGNYHDRSDVDMVICNSDIDRHILGELISEINNSNFPLTIDIQQFENIKNKQLIEHINRVGKLFYKRTIQ